MQTQIEFDPPTEYWKAADFSDDMNYRYTLTRRWDWQKPMICFIMLNPSTADGFVEDPTIRRCMKFATSWGYGGVLILNMFAHRATNPFELRRAKDPVGPQNDHYIGAMSSSIMPVVVAWGSHAGFFPERERCVLDLLEGVPLQCLSITANGHPGHPLYLRADTPLKPYRRQ